MEANDIFEEHIQRRLVQEMSDITHDQASTSASSSLCQASRSSMCGSLHNITLRRQKRRPGAGYEGD